MSAEIDGDFVVFLPVPGRGQPNGRPARLTRATSRHGG